jgi:hypothetical protein
MSDFIPQGILRCEIGALSFVAIQRAALDHDHNTAISCKTSLKRRNS